MSRRLSKSWFPITVISLMTVRLLASHSPQVPLPFDAALPGAPADTVVYPTDGYKRGWSEEEKNLARQVADSISAGGDFGFGADDGDGWTGRPAALDTLVAPDTLALTDTFRFRYWAALRDSLSHVWVRDSLISAGDSLTCTVLDSLYAADSTVAAKEAFDLWYASLDKIERRKYDAEVKSKVKLAQMDSLKAVKDSIRAYKDSLLEATPRILESYVFRDSVRFERIFSWTRGRDFGDVALRDEDTSYNYRFYDDPFRRSDAGSVWLGLPGSPAVKYDITKRDHEDGVPFYDALSGWTYTPDNLPFYNTKTPYTELSYWGSLFSGSAHGSDNLHLLTSQNITPALNITLFYDRYGGEGYISNETTANKTTVANVNYTGKRYLMHAGVIHNKVARSESGGILDNSWIRDTTVDSREISVALASASSSTVKNSLFLDQQYRIPFTFIEKWRSRRSAADTLQAAVEKQSDADTSVPEETAQPDSTAASGPDDITTAFIGHSSEYSVYRRIYKDQITTTEGRDLYGGAFWLNPTTSADSLRVSRLDNKIYLRLQPWSDDAIVSKLDVGAGHKLMHYFSFEPSYLRSSGNNTLSSTYLYAGVQGRFKKYMQWSALGHYTLLGDEAGDFDLTAQGSVNLYPFRKARNSPLSLGVHFKTSLEEPDYYSKHLVTNHYCWDNEFSKISTSELGASLNIPRWKLSADVNYSLLSGNLYYGTDALVAQNGDAMSVLGASLRKDFAWKALHLDNRVLLQWSSNEDVMPLPKLAVNSRAYVQMLIARVLSMQVGVDALYNTEWYAQAWNPALGVFYNQRAEKYGNAPVFDAFINMQWKRASIFVKLENAGMGWPKDSADYFTAHHFIRTQRAVKFGIFWPFYTLPERGNGASSRSLADTQKQ